ncbi:MAG: hypothetical protein OHK0021_07040 [Bryobacter sp.]
MRLPLGLLMSAALCFCANLDPKQGKANAKAAVAPKAGIAVPGIQIPFAKLKTEATVALPEEAKFLLFAKELHAVAGGQVARVDTKTNKSLEAWNAETALCGGLVNGFGHVWAPACDKKAILKLDPKTGKAKATLEVGAASGRLTAAATKDSVWAITDKKGTLSRIDPAENNVVAEIRIPTDCNELLYAAGALWASCPASNLVLRIDDQLNVVKERLKPVDEPVALAFGEGSLFVLGKKEGKVVQLDPKTNKVTATVETKVPNATGSLVVNGGTVWLSQAGFPLTKVDWKEGKVVQQFWGEGSGQLIFAADTLWLAPAGKKELLRIDPKRVALTLAD